MTDLLRSMHGDIREHDETVLEGPLDDTFSVKDDRVIECVQDTIEAVTTGRELG